MYTDSREDKGAYIHLTVDDPLYGLRNIDLCRECYKEKFPWLSGEDKRAWLF